MADKIDTVRRDKGQEDVRMHVGVTTAGIDDPQEARTKARELLDDYLVQKATELELAAKNFKIRQRAEFVIGALTIVQIGVWMLFLQSQPSPLIATIALCLVAYLVAAILDSKSKGRREDIRYQIQAAKKAKLKNGPDNKGVAISFE
jgi:hypothetical protein